MPSLPSPELRSKRIALCYVRLSQSREGDDAASPERQRANILAKCHELGYEPEWYEDVEGHKSGREVNNRPGWQALSRRLGSPDVVALIGNDLARFHRKGWRVGDLLEFVERHHIALILAAPGRQIDTSSPMGKVFVYLTAIFDEFYADDIAHRVKDSIVHRKRLGKSIGKAPFGTTRDKNGYLIPEVQAGAWLLSSGHFSAGQANSTPPESEAVWHTYYESAHRALRLFAEGNIGVEKLSYQLNEEGYPFSDRKGQPRRWCRDDVRRVIANWPSYAGFVFDQPAKDRPVHTRAEVDALHLDAAKAVFSVDLLKKVAYVRSERTLLALDRGKKSAAYPYPLSHITRCAHCEAQVQRENDPRLRTHLAGTGRSYGRVYRHKPGVHCGCEHLSVPCDLLEEDFGKLIKGLVVNEAALALMVELAEQNSDPHDQQRVDHAHKRQRSILKLTKKIENLKTLFREAEIDEAEYRHLLAEYRSELAYWEAYTTQREQVALQLSLCLEAIDEVARLWDLAHAEDRRSMAHNLFEYIVYNLDMQRIVDFRLKPWANRFLVLRAALYVEENEQQKTSISTRRNMPHTEVQDLLRLQLDEKNVEQEVDGTSTRRNMPHTGFDPRSLHYTTKTAATLFVTKLNRFKVLPEHGRAKPSRNAAIKARYQDGTSLAELARAFGISEQRVHQIIQGEHR